MLVFAYYSRLILILLSGGVGVNMDYREDRHLLEEPIPSLGERITGLSGAVAAIFFMAANIFSILRPAHRAPDDAVFAFYQQNAAGILMSAVCCDVGMVALVLFCVFSSRIYNALYVGLRLPFDSSRRTLLSADLLVPLSAVAATTFLVSQAVAGAAAVMAAHGTLANTIRILDEISQITGHLGMFPLGAVAFAAGLAQRAAGCGPQYVAWLGMAAGCTLMVATSGVAFDHAWLRDGGGVGLLAFLFWISGCSGAFIRMQRYS